MEKGVYKRYGKRLNTKKNQKNGNSRKADFYANATWKPTQFSVTYTELLLLLLLLLLL